MGIEEARRAQSQAAAVQGAGLEQLDLSATITFRKYSKVILPLDGYVFWAPTTEFEVQGSLHHTQQIIQAEDETLGLSTVTFTTQTEVTEFADVPIDTLYVGTLGDLRYAFSHHGGFYQAQSLWHYQGHSVYPAMLSQLLDTPGVLDPKRAVVSNSLPLWLAMNGYQSPLTGGFSNGLTLYPSFAVPANLQPPYGSVHIGEGDTRALQAFPKVKMVNVPLTAPVTDQDGNTVTDFFGDPIVVPVYGKVGGTQELVDDRGKPILDKFGRVIIVPAPADNSTPVLVPKRVSFQLMTDKVRLVLYGLQNDEAQELLLSIIEIINTQPYLGLMNMPAIRDGKRTQVELQTLAMQKVIEFEVSYYQHHAKDVALQLIRSVDLTLLVANA